jgi:hypothetical protein
VVCRRSWAEGGPLAGLLAGTGLLYLWGLSQSGRANAFYSAAAQAGSQSWTAWFFGSSDAANAITVDKTPAAYNSLGRLTGDEVGSVGGGAGAGGGWGETGLTRLFDAELAGSTSWLLPAALVLLAMLLWRTRRAPRTDPLRAAAVLWGG